MALGNRVQDQSEQYRDGTPEGGIPDGPTAASFDAQLTSRRNMLRMSALGGAALATIKPGMAQAAASLLKCSVPVPDSANSTKWIKSDGTLVAKNTSGAYAGPSSALPGEEVKNAVKFGTNYTGYNTNQSTAYTNYIKKLTQGKQGFTCYYSIQSQA
jgi:hypothetical protein